MIDIFDENGVLHPYQRINIEQVYNVIPFVQIDKAGPNPKYRKYSGFEVDMSAIRLRLFATKGTVCVHCGLSGSYFWLEKNKGVIDPTSGYHLNLYGFNRSKVETMLTRDHIVPRSKGGRDILSNLQTLCYPCNAKKADKMPKLPRIVL